MVTNQSEWGTIEAGTDKHVVLARQIERQLADPGNRGQACVKVNGDLCRINVLPHGLLHVEKQDGFDWDLFSLAPDVHKAAKLILGV